MLKKITLLAIAFLVFAPFVAYAQAAPTITSISPSSISAGSAATAITITGTNFVTGAQANIGTNELVTSFVSSTQLIATVPASILATTGSKSLIVENPDGTDSNAVTLTVATLPDTGFGPEEEGSGYTLAILAASVLGLAGLLYAAAKLNWNS